MIRLPIRRVDHDVTVSHLHRRAVLRTAVVGLAMVFAPRRAAAQNKSKNAGIKRWPKPPAGKAQPRFRKNKGTTTFVATRLRPGFYFNPRSKVVHYVAQDRRIRHVQRIKVERLKPLTIAEVTRLLSDTETRVHLATASRALEEAALDQFNANQPDTAFALLATAIRHDQRFKQAGHEAPSLRLYDLYAAKAVQLSQKARLDELLTLTRQGEAQVTRPAPQPAARAAAGTAKAPTSEFRRLQVQRKAATKSAAVTAHKTSYTARLKKWNTTGDNAWKQRWEKKGHHVEAVSGERSNRF